MTDQRHRGEPVGDRVVRALRREGTADCATIARALGETTAKVHSAVRRLIEAGRVRRVGRTLYELAEPVTSTRVK